ncbi:MAG: TauD/TfdA family dioxygenase [Actinomycetota bacterium]
MRIDATTVRDFNRIRVEPLTGSIGAEIAGVDLRELDDELIAELRQAWLDHKVLFFRNQDLTQEQHIAYGRALGELEVHPFSPQAEGHPEILVLESKPDRFEAAESWHTDVTFRECPALGSILLGRVIPPYGGDTCWANMELAYELLPDDIKEEIDGAYAVHSYVKAFGRRMSDEERAEASAKYPDQKHPLVRTHPETGRKSLFMARPFMLTIDGMTAEESRPLRYRLYEQSTIPEIQCRFRWQVNSIAQWDNRCTQHYAVPDHGGHHRRMERVTLIGDRPA